LGSSARCGHSADQHVGGDDTLTRRVAHSHKQGPVSRAASSRHAGVQGRPRSAPHNVSPPPLHARGDFCVVFVVLA
jgi:hypothetical protein